MKWLKPILAALMLYTGAARAQFTDSTQHYISYATTGIINQTNDVRNYVLTNLLRFSIRKHRYSLNSNTSWIYGAQKRTINNNDLSSTFDANFFNKPSKFYYWALGSFDKSYSLKITDRLQAGAGVAYNFFDTTNAFLNISDGLLYEYADLTLADKSRDMYNTVRNSFRLRYHFVIRNIIVLDGTNFLQNSLLDGSDYIIKATNSVSVKLRKWLSISAAATYNKLQRTSRENLLVTFGLTAEKYF